MTGYGVPETLSQLIYSYKEKFSSGTLFGVRLSNKGNPLRKSKVFRVFFTPHQNNDLAMETYGKQELYRMARLPLFGSKVPRSFAEGC